VNGFSPQGGFKAELGARGGLAGRGESRPEWLFHGDNEIRFSPVDQADPMATRCGGCT